jgi:hypothetical protein
VEFNEVGMVEAVVYSEIIYINFISGSISSGNTKISGCVFVMIVVVIVVDSVPIEK